MRSMEILYKDKTNKELDNETIGILLIVLKFDVMDILFASRRSVV